MRKLVPVRDKASYHRAIYAEIKALLERILFEPIIKIAEAGLQNAVDSVLLTALRKGDISYANGYFRGKFSASIGLAIRKIGGSFDRGRKAYFLPEADLPQDVKISIARGRADVQTKVDNIKEKLDSLQKDGAIPTINFERQVAGITMDLDQQFRTTVPEDIGLPMTQDAVMKRALSEGYTDNMNLYIQGMTRQSAQRLREQVVEHVEQGGRAADLLPLIHAQKGVSDRHALFLAKQETSILVSSYRDTRYREAGVKKYIWSTSHDRRVRPDHRALDGRTFNFSEPPITDTATGARNNPGYDYGCRCVAIPILADDDPIRYSVSS